MQGSEAIVKALNKVLYNELVAINQYTLHSRMLKNWGVTKLAAYEHQESIDEMRHADALVERILFLDGLPNLQDLGKLLIGEDVKEILDCDLKLELQALPALKDGIAACERERDRLVGRHAHRPLPVRVQPRLVAPRARPGRHRDPDHRRARS